MHEGRVLEKDHESTRNPTASERPTMQTAIPSAPLFPLTSSSSRMAATFPQR